MLVFDLFCWYWYSCLYFSGLVWLLGGLDLLLGCVVDLAVVWVFDLGWFDLVLVLISVWVFVLCYTGWVFVVFWGWLLGLFVVVC